METTIPTLTATIDTHLAGYAEADPDRRRELLTAAWQPTGSLVDPPLEGTGIDAIAGLVDAVLAHCPGHRFVRTTDVDTHHGYARYGWKLVDADGTEAVTGTDIATIGVDGKLVSIVGFFGDLVPAADTTP